MIPDELGMRLHDRATRGLPLSAEEQQQLQAWYEEQDRAEAEMLGLTQLAPIDNSDVQAQIKAAEARLAQVTRRHQDLAAQNTALRAEIAALRAKLAARDSHQRVG